MAVLGEATKMNGEVYDRVDLQQAVRATLRTLTEREQKILSLRYGLCTGSEMSLAEVGEVEGCGAERIRQLVLRAIRKIRHSSRSGLLKPFAPPPRGTSYTYECQGIADSNLSDAG